MIVVARGRQLWWKRITRKRYYRFDIYYENFPRSIQVVSPAAAWVGEVSVRTKAARGRGAEPNRLRRRNLSVDGFIRTNINSRPYLEKL